jgi:hypothetical protein
MRSRTESEIIKRSSLKHDLHQHSTIVEPKRYQDKRISLGNEDIRQHSLMATHLDCGDQGSVSSEILEKKPERGWVSNSEKKGPRERFDSDQEFDIHFDNLYEAYIQRGQGPEEPKKEKKGEEAVNPESGKASSDKGAIKSKDQVNHKAVLLEDFDIGIELGLGESMSDSSEYKSQNDGKPIPGKINIFWDDGHSVQVDGQIVKKSVFGQFDNLTAKSQATMVIAPKDLIEVQNQEFERTNNLLYKGILKSFRFWITFVILTFSLAVNYLYMINIKSFGLQYFTDEFINSLSLVMVPIAFCGRLGSGIIVDKIGVITTYRMILALSAISQV